MNIEIKKPEPTFVLTLTLKEMRVLVESLGATNSINGSYGLYRETLSALHGEEL